LQVKKMGSSTDSLQTAEGVTSGAAIPAKATTASHNDRSVAYLIVTGAKSASYGHDLLRGLVAMGFASVIVIPTPNASRVVCPLNLAEVPAVKFVESYFDESISPRPQPGLVLVAPCTFNSLNKLAQGMADNLAMSVAAEAIGRRTPVIVAPSLNQPLFDHPRTQISLRALHNWGVQIVPPSDANKILAPVDQVLAAVRSNL
jgi:phosphopantothenoylcysteine synthetase/decarboxylase